MTSPRHLLASVAIALLLGAAWASNVHAEDPPPGLGATFWITSANPSTTGSLTFGLVFSEAVTGLEATDLSRTGTAPGCQVGQPSGGPTEYAISVSGCANGTVRLTLGAETVLDGAGASGPAEAVASPEATIAIPPTKLSGSVKVNGGAASTADPTLNLALTAGGFGANLTMRFSLDDGASWTAAEPFAAKRDLPLPAKWRWGKVVVKVRLADAGGATLTVSDGIDYGRIDQSAMALRPRYVIEASLSYANARLTAHQTIDITNASNRVIGQLDFSVLARHYGELSITKVTVDGRAAGVSYPNTASMRVPLGFNLRPGEDARVVIDFTATAKSSTGDYLKARFAKANGIFQVSSWHPLLSDGHGLRLPGDSQFSVAADYRVELNHPSGVVIAAPGKLVASSSTRKVYELAHAREYAFAASPNYRRSDTKSSTGVAVSVYSLAGTSGVSTALSISAKALANHEAAFGAYPYSRYVVAQAARGDPGLEYSGIVLIGRLNFGYKLMIAHEVAHQWWYGIVGNDQLGEPWLDEAFAEWSSRYLFGYGMPSFCSSKPVDSPVSAFPATSTGCQSYAETVYHKGAALLHGLRQRMGSAKFMAALRAIVAEHRYGVATTGSVRAVLLRFAADKRSIGGYIDGFLR